MEPVLGSLWSDVNRRSTNKQAAYPFLPIGIVYHDRDKNLFLIELPHEADSGTNRLWAGSASILQPRQQKEPAVT